MKTRNKVSAEFSMSSLTDIIFLLLIFFMLTSNMVQINMELPTSVSTTVSPTDLAVMITKDGTYTVNAKKTSSQGTQLEKRIAFEVRQQTNKQNATVSVIAEVGTPWKYIHRVMVEASKLQLKAIIATSPPDKK